MKNYMPTAVVSLVGLSILFQTAGDKQQTGTTSRKQNSALPTRSDQKRVVPPTQYLSPERLMWTVYAGANEVTVGPDELSMRQRERMDTTDFAIASAPLKRPKPGAWRVTFEVRFGQLGSSATAVALFDGPTLIGWVGADAYYKVLGSFFGKDFFATVDLKPFPLADTNWHTFEFRGEGSLLSLWRDGKEVAKHVLKATPDTLKVGQIHRIFGEKPTPFQQTETWMRAVRVE